jgi:hypothetical protein
MKKSDIYEIAIKIVGLYLFYDAIGYLMSVLTNFTMMLKSTAYSNTYSDFYDSQYFLLSLMQFAFITFFAFMITAKTKNIVKLICHPDDYNENAKLFAERKSILQIALVIIGLFIVIYSFPEFLMRIKFYIQSRSSENRADAQEFSYIIVAAIRITLGLLSVFFSKKISNLLIREKAE